MIWSRPHAKGAENLYGPAVRNQLNNTTPLLDMFEKEDNVSWEGREHIEPVRLNRNRGVYATAEGGRAASAGAQVHDKFRIPLRYVHGTIQLTGQSMKVSRSNAGAFSRALQLEMDGLLDDLRVSRNFYLWGDGRAVRALINGAPGTTSTYTVDSPMGVAGPDHGNRFLNVGDYVVTINPNTGLLRAGGTRQITGIAAGGTTVTIGAASDAAVADNDYVVKAYGSDSSIAIGNTEWQHPPMGMLGHIDDGTYVNMYHGLSRATYPILRGTVIGSVGALSADVLQRAVDVAAQLGQANIDYHWVHHTVRRAYLSMMENDRRYTQERLMRPDAGTEIAAGHKAPTLTFGGVPIEVDQFAPYGTWFGCDSRSFVRFVNTEGEWVDEDGAVLSRLIDQADEFRAVYRVYDNFFVGQPNQSFRLDAITANVVVAHIV